MTPLPRLSPAQAGGIERVICSARDGKFLVRLDNQNPDATRIRGDISRKNSGIRIPRSVYLKAKGSHPGADSPTHLGHILADAVGENDRLGVAHNGQVGAEIFADTPEINLGG